MVSSAITFSKIISAPHAIQRIVPTQWPAKGTRQLSRIRLARWGLFWAYQWLSPEGTNIPGRLFGLIEYKHCSSRSRRYPRCSCFPQQRQRGPCANASLNSAKPVSGLADVLAIAGEEPDAVRQGVRVAGRRHRRDTISGKGRVMVRMCAATPHQRHHKNAG